MMDPSTYEQVTVDQGIFGEQSRWLSDGMEVSMSILTSGEVVIGEFYVLFKLGLKGGHVDNFLDSCLRL